MGTNGWLKKEKLNKTNLKILNKSLWETTVATRQLLVSSKREKKFRREINSCSDQVCDHHLLTQGIWRLCIGISMGEIEVQFFSSFNYIRCHCIRHGFDQYKHCKTWKSCLY